ncbi:hypothetical protein [Nitrosospira sp. Is2]|uniref:hypothetical protein n=1 Tax=Nitrosospira sp. Is2 TaxID=3080532 RepID=UPI002953DC13|nr:hypothetical protein [Nitrosospira sp. Is2]WON74536.1 hypothetical protein R5L00_03345 [Nitrosospira sp. Is2]
MSNYPPTDKSLFGVWLTVKLLAEAEPSFTESAIRNYVFNAASRHTSKGPIPGNGLAPHISRIGAKVLINHGGFLCWIDGNRDAGGSSTSPTDYTQPIRPAECGKTAFNGKQGNRRQK